MRASRSDLAGDHAEQADALVIAERDIGSLQRHRGAVDGGERRAQLVGDGRDEVALQPLDRVLLGEVAERVDRPLDEGHTRDGQPALAPVDLDRHRLGPRGRDVRDTADRHALADVRPDRQDVGQLLSDDVAVLEAAMASAARFQSRTMPPTSRTNTPSPTNSSA